MFGVMFQKILFIKEDFLEDPSNCFRMSHALIGKRVAKEGVNLVERLLTKWI